MNRELRRGGLRLRLSEQPFRVLAMLLERPGELVTRDQIQQRPRGRQIGPEGAVQCAPGKKKVID